MTISSFSRRLNKLEIALNYRESVHLVKHQYLDWDGNVVSTSYPGGFTSDAQAEEANPDKAITWVIVRHVPGRTINFDDRILEKGPTDHEPK